MFDRIKTNYCGTFDIFRRYWRAYGGFCALLSSVYLHLSILITLVCYNIWSKPEWWEVPLAVLPNVIGFSLGGYAMLLSFGSDKFQSLLSRVPVDQTNAFAELSASFVHFILIQLSALTTAFICKALYCEPPRFLMALVTGVGLRTESFFALTRIVGWGFGTLLFVYALACGAAATMRVFRLSETFAKFSVSEFTGDKPNKPRDG
jgi:hypothetical protein